MRRRYYLSLAALLSFSFAGLALALFSGGSSAVEADNPPAVSKVAKSRIDKVTVYPNSALVTREVEVPDGDGLIELVVNPMPDRIVPSTMYSEAGEGLRVLTTRFSTWPVLEDTSVERRKLEADLEQLQIQAAKINSEIASIQTNMTLLNKLEIVTEKGKHSGDEVITLSKYVMEQRTEKAKQLVGIMEEKRLNDIQLNFNQRKMAELGRSSGKTERQAVIVVDRENGKGGKIRLNYLVGAVTWRPEYKLRAGKVEDNVQVEYLANLMQHTGEDWNQCSITLSTAAPTLESSPPELCMLQPILVHRGTPGAPPMQAGGGFGSAFANPYSDTDLEKKAKKQRSLAQSNSLKDGRRAEKENSKLLNEASAIEQNLELMQPREQVLAQAKNTKLAANSTRTDGPSVTYHLNSRLSIPSRNNEQIVEITKLKLSPKFYYKAVPVLNRHVYRLADLVNKSSHELLPGEATMYQGSDFVGRMAMPLVAIGEEFTAGFGVDTQLQISRQMIDQTRSTKGGNQVLKYDYRILISSYKNEQVKLQLWDRLPKGAEAESVNVILGKCSPDLSSDGIYVRESWPNNLLRWDVEVPANCNGEKAFAVTYDFSMELDRQMAITGFQSR